MKIVFIIPPHTTFKDFISPGLSHRQKKKKDGRIYGNLITDMPLGPLSISAYLKKHTKDTVVELLDFNVILNSLEAFPYGSFLEFFYDYFSQRKIEADYVGISALFSPSYDSMLDIAQAYKKLNAETFILAGGNIPTTMYRNIFSNVRNNIDAICYGEGEKPLLELIQKGRSIFDTNDSWITKEKLYKAASFTPEHDFIWDLDEIPMYDYALCGDDYFENPAFTTYGVIKKKAASAHVMTSRGCPFKCIFCASHKVHGRKMRYYSIDRVKNEFLFLKEKMGVETLVFQDDHLMGDKKRALEIIKYVGEIGCRAVFQNSLALYALDREMLEAIKRSGIDQLVLSVESGSDRVLKEVMKKPLKLTIVEQVARNCRDLGIYTYANILIGLPGETKEDIEEARIFLRSIKANWFGIFCATPLVGSEMHELCEKNGYLDKSWIGSDYKTAAIHTPDWTTAYIQEMTYIFNLELNFIYNSDFALEDYATALSGFERAINAKEDHAIAYYYASICANQTGETDKALDYLLKYMSYANLPIWSKYITQYKHVMDQCAHLAHPVVS